MAMTAYQPVGAFDEGVREGRERADAEIKRLTIQRDALLAACEEALECFRFEVEETVPVKDRLIAAIKQGKTI